MEQALNILLIEDNPGDAFLLKFYLEDSVLRNAVLTHAESLKSALALISQTNYDIVILDLHLPDSNGIETLDAILDVNKDTVAIVLTGLQDEELGIQLVKMGAQDFLVKGQFDGKVFTQSVRYAFERAKIRKQLKQYSFDLNRSEFRFDVLQKLCKCAYWRIMLETNEVLVSEYFNEYIRPVNEVNSIEKFAECFLKEEKENITSKILNALATKTGFEINTTLFDGRKANIICDYYFVENIGKNVIAGIIKITP